MILDWLIGFVFAVIGWVLDALPDYSSSSSAVSDALRTVASPFGFLRNWINVPAIMGVIALWVTIEIASGVAALVQWVYARVPFKAT